MSRFLESQLQAPGAVLPTQRSEAWRYTSLKGLEQRALAVGDAAAASHEIPAALLGVIGDSAPRLVFVNGVLRTECSTLPEDAGFGIERDAVARRDRGSADGADVLDVLNDALARETIRINVEPGVRVTRPLHLVHVGAPGSAALAWYGRFSVALGAGSALEVVEHHLAAAPHANVANVRVDCVLDAGARLRWTRLQRAGEAETLFTHARAVLGADATLEHAALDAGGALVRHRLAVLLGALGAAFHARGVFALRGRQHADTQLEVVHDARDTRCDIAYRGLADGRARGVFGGSIVMRPGADGADARLENKNLLLSPHAEIDTKPVLEIHADDVKASHGATVGQLDERALFYLRSRGLPVEEARSMLTYAFCASMFDSLPEAARVQANALLADRLAPLAADVGQGPSA